jgi:hypothetical protein
MAFVPQEDVITVVTEYGMRVLETENIKIGAMGSSTYWLSR